MIVVVFEKQRKLELDSGLVKPLEGNMAPPTVFELREQAKKKSPLLLDSSLVIAEIPLAKVEFQRDDGSYGTVKVPSSDYSSVENIIYCYQEFVEVARVKGWIGANRDDKYRETLNGTARELWDAAVAEGPNNHQEATFRENIRTVLRNIAGLGSYDRLIEYMEKAKKPYKMSPAMVSRRLSTLCRVAPLFLQEDGSEGPEITELKQKRLLLSMMPNDWISKFEDSGATVAESSIAQIVRYMTNHWASY